MYIYIYMIAIYVYIFIHNTYIASLYNSLFFFLKNIYIYIYIRCRNVIKALLG